MKLSRIELATLASFASRDDSRPNLSAVTFDAPHNRVFATDGHRLAVLEAPGNGATSPVVVSLSDVRRILGATVSGGQIVVGDGEAVTHRQGAEVTLVTFSPVLGAKPPAIESVIPRDLHERKASASRLGVNAGYLASLRLVSKAVGNCALHVYPPPTPEDPLVIRAGLWTVLIMPMHLSPHDVAKVEVAH